MISLMLPNASRSEVIAVSRMVARMKVGMHVTRARDAVCDHSQWSWDTHGRVCDCGAFMVDFGD